jgi:hypothetical protein
MARKERKKPSEKRKVFPIRNQALRDFCYYRDINRNCLKGESMSDPVVFFLLEFYSINHLIKKMTFFLRKI